MISLESSIKLIIILLVLYFVYLLKDRKDTNNGTYSFLIHKLNLSTAYKIYIIFILEIFVLNVSVVFMSDIYAKKNFYNDLLVFGMNIVFILSMFILFVIFIKRPFIMKWSDIGIDFKSFSLKAMPIFVFIMLLAALHIYLKGDGINLTKNISAKMTLLPILISWSIFEELIYRLILWHAFMKKMNIYIAAIISSLCFSIWHFEATMGGHVWLMIYGLLLSWAYYKSKTTLVPMTIHAQGNILIMLIYR